MAQQNERDIICPITIILNGPTSYHARSQNMTVFLKGCKLWRYVTGSIPKPIPNPKSKATLLKSLQRLLLQQMIMKNARGMGEYSK